MEETMRRSFSLPILLPLLVYGCTPSPSANLEANKQLIEQFTEVINSANWDALDTLLVDDFRRHSQATAGPAVESREAFKELQKGFYAIMPDQRVDGELVVAEGDFVAMYATYSGTMTGPMGEFQPTGRSAESKFLSIFRIEDGKIAELWVEWDNLAMLTQLGLFPPPATPSPAD
jgi:steroid delta-isomerase-like uncharacterized protein